MLLLPGADDGDADDATAAEPTDEESTNQLTRQKSDYGPDVTAVDDVDLQDSFMDTGFDGTDREQTVRAEDTEETVYSLTSPSNWNAIKLCCPKVCM